MTPPAAAPEPAAESCPRIAGAALHAHPLDRWLYHASLASLSVPGMALLLRSGLCIVCGAAVYEDAAGVMWHASPLGLHHLRRTREPAP